MSDDLNVLLYYIDYNLSLTKIAIKIEHGLNNDISECFEYWGEPENSKKIIELLPLYISNNINKIVDIIKIDGVIIA